MSLVDLVIRGGMVVDPAGGTSSRADIAVHGGRIHAIAPSLDLDGRATLDARALLVTPGLIDLHVHVYHGVADLSVEADPTCLGRGVTTAVDAGSAGANTFPGFRRHVVGESVGRILAFLNISAMGQIDPFLGELHDLRFADPERAAEVANANRDVVVGFKVRVSERLAGPNGLAGLERALEVGRATELPVMVHIGGTAFDIEEVLGRLGPGDVVTHAFTGWAPGIVTDVGRVVDAAREARARGVRFDVGHGAGSFSWAVAEAALEDGFRPDTVSSDLHRFNVAGPVHDLVTTMSKFLHLGFAVTDVIALATAAPAAALGRPELGRLAIGDEADVTLLRLEDGRFELHDAHGASRTARQRLVPVAVVRAGRPLPIVAAVTAPPAGIAPR